MSFFNIFFLYFFYQGFRVNIPLRARQNQSAKSVYPIKLFYTSNMPIILQSALVSNAYFLSQIMWTKFGSGKFAYLLAYFGKWDRVQSGQVINK